MPPGPAPKSSDHKSSRRNRSSVGCVIISPEDTDIDAPRQKSYTSLTRSPTPSRTPQNVKIPKISNIAAYNYDR